MIKIRIFTPHQIGNLKIKNRVVRSATYRGMATDDGQVTEKEITVYENLAKNEIGLIVSGYMYVTKEGQCLPRQLGIYDDSLMPGLKKLVASVKQYEDVKFFAQIAHGGRQTVPIVSEEIYAPSPIADKFTHTIPKEMTIEHIKRCVRGFVDAAKRVHEAGFDGVQLQCAHGYLLSQFLSPYCNRRTDSYGGSIENRFRIIEEIITGIQDELNKTYPITAKLNMADFVIENPQLTIEESKIFAKMMVDLGISAIEVSGALMESILYEGNLGTSRFKISKIEDEAYFLNEAKTIKNEIGETPVILVGGIRSLEVVNKVLEEGIDFVALSRPFIREPDLITKWKNGLSDKADCISCNSCYRYDKPKGNKCEVLKRLERKKKKMQQKNQ